MPQHNPLSRTELAFLLWSYVYWKKKVWMFNDVEETLCIPSSLSEGAYADKKWCITCNLLLFTRETARTANVFFRKFVTSACVEFHGSEHLIAQWGETLPCPERESVVCSRSTPLATFEDLLWQSLTHRNCNRLNKQFLFCFAFFLLKAILCFVKQFLVKQKEERGSTYLQILKSRHFKFFQLYHYMKWNYTCRFHFLVVCVLFFFVCF